MPALERPPITGIGKIDAVREPGRLFDVEMPNGHVAIAVIERGGPSCPEAVLGRRAEVAFSPFDMSRCKIQRFIEDRPD